MRAGQAFKGVYVMKVIAIIYSVALALVAVTLHKKAFSACMEGKQYTAKF